MSTDKPARNPLRFGKEEWMPKLITIPVIDKNGGPPPKVIPGVSFVNTLANVKRMVIGFAYDLVNNKLVLVRKNRPRWMAGQLNGAGGKVEGEETAEACMVREFHEELGVLTSEEDWLLFHYEKRRDGPELFFFCASLHGVSGSVRTMTDEEVVLLDLEQWDKGLHRHTLMVYNLNFLIPMGLCYLQHPQHRYDLAVSQGAPA